MFFSEYIKNQEPPIRLKMLNHLERYGNPNEVIRHIDAMPLCYRGNTSAMWIDERFIVRYTNGVIFNSPKWYIHETANYDHCFYSKTSVAGFYNRSKRDLIKIDFKKDTNAIAVYNTLRRYLNAFDTCPSTFTQAEFTQNPVFALFINDKNIVLRCKRMFHKEYEFRQLAASQSVIWCTQHHIYDGDGGPDTFRLKLYLSTGTFAYLDTLSEEDSCDVLFALKDNIPHLLYGPNPTYEQLFKKDPAALMTVAKNLAKHPR